MAAEYEELVSKVVIQIAQAKAALAELEKSAGQATQKIEGIGSKGDNAFTSLGSSLKRLAGTFGIVLTAGAVVSFIKRVGESTRQVGLLAARSGQAEKSVRALQNQFKALGYSEAEANSTLENFTQSFSNFAFKGEIGGLAQSFLSLGVNIVDVNGKMKDMNDLLIQAGDAALSINGGDRVKAQQLMLSMGFSTAQADLATRADRRQRMEQMKREAIASKEAAEKTEKLAGALNNLGTKLVDLVLQADKSFGIFDKLSKGIEASTEVIRVLGDAVGQLGGIFTDIGNVCTNLFKDIGIELERFSQSAAKALGSEEGVGNDFHAPAPEDYKQNKSQKAQKEAIEATGEAIQKGAEKAKGAFDQFAESLFQGSRTVIEALGLDTTPVAPNDVWGESNKVGAGASDEDIKRHLANNLKKSEGLRLQAYQDTGGVWTIGYGHTGNDVKPGMTITQEEAERLLKKDVDRHADKALSIYAGKSAQTRYMAADLAYNSRERNWGVGSRFYNLANSGEISKEDYANIAVRDAKGNYLRGLRNRRINTYQDAMAFYPRVTPYIPRKQEAGNANPQGDSTKNTNTTINIYAPTNDAGDIAKETLKYLPRTSTYVSPMA